MLLSKDLNSLVWFLAITVQFSGYLFCVIFSKSSFVEGLPGVVKVFQNRFYKLHTTHSNDFLDDSSSSSHMQEDLTDVKLTDDGVIIGVLDSGN